jgi:hypothetical protein
MGQKAALRELVRRPPLRNGCFGMLWQWCKKQNANQSRRLALQYSKERKIAGAPLRYQALRHHQ